MEEFHRHECRYFDTCAAPLCPLDVESLKRGTWFPDEEVCIRNIGLEWVKTQRKIQRKGVPFSAGSFTHEMLAINPKASEDLQGVEDYLDPRQVSRWIEEQRGKAREAVKRSRKRKSRNTVQSPELLLISSS